MLDEVKRYARMFSQNIGHTFTETTIRITAMTGAAAMEIGGRTAASVYSLRKPKSNVSQEEINSFRDTRMNIIDEISFASYNHDLANLNDHLKKFTECNNLTFGKAPIVFLGDFCQLDCINGSSIYKNKNGILWEQALNCMVELKGIHRYKDCEVMSDLMPKIREHGLSEKQREKLNERVVGFVDKDGKKVELPDPEKVRYATYGNKKRCEINAKIFKDYLSRYHRDATETNIPFTAIVIKSRILNAKTKTELSFEQRQTIFEECPDSEVKKFFEQQKM